MTRKPPDPRPTPQPPPRPVPPERPQPPGGPGPVPGILACIALLLVLVACAPVAINNSDDTITSICFDIEQLATDIQDDGDILSDRWIEDIDSLGIRAAGIDSDEGEELMEAIAKWSVGLENSDLDLALDGLEKIQEVCS